MPHVHKLSLTSALFVIALAAVALAQRGQAPQQASAFTEIYHVHFTKAVPGQAAALADDLRTQDPKAAMPGHLVLLRHQEGDDWDYMQIEHIGTKATVEIPTAPPAPARNFSAWHDDTFVAGPPWADFAREMGIGSGSNSPNAVYVVSVMRAVPGHRQQLQELLSSNTPSAKIQTGSVLLRHLEGGPWTFVGITRYNSWQDFAVDEAAGMTSGAKRWTDTRQHADFHRDTIADRIAPK